MATPDPEFDAYAADYDRALQKGLALTGEGKDFYANGRLKLLAKMLGEREHAVARCLDFGCGTGSATPFLYQHLHATQVVGIDPSDQSLEVARATHGSAAETRFENTQSFQGEGNVDLAFCNGVFHHIPLDDRLGAAKQVFEALRPGGLFALWENNAWNPATRFVMSRVPFDRDAILVWPCQARRLLREAGFDILRTDFAFVFPGFLKGLRFLEPALQKFPLGGQYQVLARKRS